MDPPDHKTLNAMAYCRYG